MTDDEILTERVQLEWLKWVSAQAVSRELMSDLRLTVMQDHLFGSLLLRLEKQLLTHTFAMDRYEAELRVPASWWDHWKEAHGRKWLGPWWMRRYPVRTRNRTAYVEVKRMHSYPEAKIQVPEFGRPVIVETVKGPLWNR